MVEVWKRPEKCQIFGKDYILLPNVTSLTWNEESDWGMKWDRDFRCEIKRPYIRPNMQGYCIVPCSAIPFHWELTCSPGVRPAVPPGVRPWGSPWMRTAPRREPSGLSRVSRERQRLLSQSARRRVSVPEDDEDYEDDDEDDVDYGDDEDDDDEDEVCTYQP